MSDEARTREDKFNDRLIAWTWPAALLLVTVSGIHALVTR